MKLIQAKVYGTPRLVNTKFGDRGVLDCRTADGDTVSIWRSADDPEVMNRANGELVTLAIDSKGKPSLVETAQTRAIAAQAGSMGYTVTTPTPASTSSKSAEIADYIERLSKLYSHCYKSASTELAYSDLPPTEIKDISSCLFIQTVKHYQL